MDIWEKNILDRGKLGHMCLVLKELWAVKILLFICLQSRRKVLQDKSNYNTR